MVKKGVLSPAATKEFGIMTSDSIELSQVIAKKSRDPHRKRLDSRRVKSPNQTKRLNDNKGIDSRESKTDDSSFSSSASSSSSDVSSVIMAGKYERCRKSVESKTVTCETYGTISVIGRRREMEDTVKIALDFLTLAEDKDTNRMRYDFYAVYDGHGGSRVAHACRDKLHRVLAEEVGVTETGKEGGGVDWEKVMVVSFGKVDDDVNRSFGNATAVSSLSSANTIGSTAVVAVVGKDKVVVGNCGDSRAVLCRGGVAIALSNDHKPDRPDELERVEALGGRVINWNGHRVLGVLATSRSIGDGYLKPFVISNPEVLVSERTDKDEFLILASDGLWDVVSNEVACKVVRRCLDGRMRRRCQEPVRDKSLNGSGRAAEAAAVLATLAMARGSKDNISIIVVELRKCGGGLGC